MDDVKFFMSSRYFSFIFFYFFLHISILLQSFYFAYPNETKKKQYKGMSKQ